MLEHERAFDVKIEELTSPVVKVHPGQVHLKGFSPVWVRECVSRIVSGGLERESKGDVLNSLLSVNDLPQCLHLYGLSPRWLRSCRSSVACLANAFPQTEHEKFLSRKVPLALVHVSSGRRIVIR